MKRSMVIGIVISWFAHSATPAAAQSKNCRQRVDHLKARLKRQANIIRPPHSPVREPSAKAFYFLQEHGDFIGVGKHAVHHSGKKLYWPSTRREWRKLGRYLGRMAKSQRRRRRRRPVFYLQVARTLEVRALYQLIARIPTTVDVRLVVVQNARSKSRKPVRMSPAAYRRAAGNRCKPLASALHNLRSVNPAEKANYMRTRVPGALLACNCAGVSPKFDRMHAALLVRSERHGWLRLSRKSPVAARASVARLARTLAAKLTASMKANRYVVMAVGGKSSTGRDLDSRTDSPSRSLDREIARIKRTGETVGTLRGPTRPDRTTRTKPSAAGTRSRVIVAATTGRDAVNLRATVVRRTIRSRYLNGLRACYERLLQRRAGKTGTLRIRFVVAATGRVAAVRMRGLSASLRHCVSRRVGRWRFRPKPKNAAGTPTRARFAVTVRLVAY